MSEEVLPSDALSDILRDLKEDTGVCVMKPTPDRYHVFMISPEKLAMLAQQQGSYHVVSMYDRPGAAYFANYLEYTYFPPDTPQNDLMLFVTYRWNGQLWSIISVPEDFKYACEDAAEKADLRIANGVPITNDGPLRVVFTSRPNEVPENLRDKIKVFPLDGDNVFTLENKRGDVMYEGRGGMQDARHLEDYKLEKLWEKYHTDEDDPSLH